MKHKEDVEAYFQRHGLDALLEEITTALKDHRPADPISFFRDYFENKLFVQQHTSTQSDCPDDSDSSDPEEEEEVNSAKAKAQLTDVGCFLPKDNLLKPIEIDRKLKPSLSPIVQSCKPVPVLDDNWMLEPSTPKEHEPLQSYFSFDIGGSLCKICICIPSKSTGIPKLREQASTLCDFIGAASWCELDEDQTLHNEDGSVLKFAITRSSMVPKIIDDLKANGFLPKGQQIVATGGGAYKFTQAFASAPGIEVLKRDELWTLLRGMNYLLENCPNEAYCFQDFVDNQVEAARPSTCTWTNHHDLYPYILVNIGSGCSILKVDGPTTFERVSGTCIGGGTYWGLVKALCSPDRKMTADEAFRLALGGEKTNVDLCVRDIYGGDYKKFNLRGETVAAAFGKVAILDKPIHEIEGKDIARSLLDMIGMNIAQLAYLNARRFNTPRIVFAGNFLRHNNYTMKALAYSINYWSKTSFEAAFLKHEGYFGACGALMAEEVKANPRPSARRSAPTISAILQESVPGASEERLQQLRHRSKSLVGQDHQVVGSPPLAYPETDTTSMTSSREIEITEV